VHRRHRDDQRLRSHHRHPSVCRPCRHHDDKLTDSRGQTTRIHRSQVERRSTRGSPSGAVSHCASPQCRRVRPDDRVRAASKDYVAFADDDSWWAPGSLHAAADILGCYPTVAAQILIGPEQRVDPISGVMARSPLPRASTGHPTVLGVRRPRDHGPPVGVPKRRRIRPSSPLPGRGGTGGPGLGRPRSADPVCRCTITHRRVDVTPTLASARSLGRRSSLRSCGYPLPPWCSGRSPRHRARPPSPAGGHTAYAAGAGDAGAPIRHLIRPDMTRLVRRPETVLPAGEPPPDDDEVEAFRPR
jgi:hypothetical protein